MRHALLLTSLVFAGCSTPPSSEGARLGKSADEVRRSGGSSSDDADSNAADKEVDGVPARGMRSFVGEAAMQKACAEDLLNQNEGARATTRYFSLVHLYDAGQPSEQIAVAAQGVAKLMNSLSQSSEIVKVESFNKEHTLIRVDLQDFGWDDEQWNRLIKTYPYLIVPEESKALGVLQQETGTQVPIVRADWFLATASRPPLYYQLTGASGSLDEFEQKLGIKIAQNVAARQVMRAGFNNSVVSKENRVIERHALRSGALWRSYEFGTSKGQQDILQNPLGPASNGIENFKRGDPGGGQIDFPFPFSGDSRHSFVTDGGEFIYTLPNGMLAFYIAGKTRNRLDEAPVEAGQEKIIVGMSCMSCHSRGVIEKNDMVRKAAANDPKLADALTEINAIYPETAAFNKQVAEDSDRYEKALADAGVDPKIKDPVYRIAKPYDGELSKEQIAAELGVEPSALEKALPDTSAMSRADFKAGFKGMVEAVKP